MSSHSSVAIFNNRFHIGDIVRHFKWFNQPIEDAAKHKYLYEILGLGTSTVDESISVVYRSLSDNRIWIRPVEEFCSPASEPSCCQYYRFEVI